MIWSIVFAMVIAAIEALLKYYAGVKNVADLPPDQRKGLAQVEKKMYQASQEATRISLPLDSPEVLNVPDAWSAPRNPDDPRPKCGDQYVCSVCSFSFVATSDCGCEPPCMPAFTCCDKAMEHQ